MRKIEIFTLLVSLYMNLDSEAIQMVNAAEATSRYKYYNFCNRNKCENNSTCLPMNPEDIDSSATCRLYTCECQIGFDGTYCEKDQRPCSNFRCINNSTCVANTENPMDFHCVCQKSFSGRFCEFNRICQNVTCLNNGNCISIFNSYACLCPMYYSGTHCEIRSESLDVLENVSRSISIVGILAIAAWFSFIIALDLSRFIFKIEPRELNTQRRRRKNKKTQNRIDKFLRKLYAKYRKIEKKIQNGLLNKSEICLTHRFSLTSIRYIDDDESSSTE